MKHIKSTYKEAFSQHGRDPKSLFIPKHNQEIRFKSLTNHIKDDKFTILDFGCGLGDLKKQLDVAFTNYQYTGVDIVEEFIKSNQKEDRQSEYFKIDRYDDIEKEYDYIVIAGVFNLLYSDSIDEHKNIVFNTLEYLFNKTKKTLSVNFMSDYVDFKQENAYHQNEEELLKFIRETLSNRFTLDCSYMPYEFTVTIFKNTSINQNLSVYSEVL